MKGVIDLVLAHIDKLALSNLIDQLRALDNELDMKMEDIRVAQLNISVMDRINIFTNTDAELHLIEENRVYKEIQDKHGQVIFHIRELIRAAIYQDFGLAMKVQTTEIMKAAAALRVKHRWGIGGKAHEYEINGLEPLRNGLGHLASMINAQFNFPHEPLDVDNLLNLVYDDLLRKEGFVE